MGTFLQVFGIVGKKEENNIYGVLGLFKPQHLVVVNGLKFIVHSLILHFPVFPGLSELFSNHLTNRNKKRFECCSIML